MGARGDSPWVEETQPPPVRSYAVTGGRTAPSQPMDLACLVRARRARPAGPAVPEAQQVLEMCLSEPRSVAEIAGLLRRPVQVTKILLADLIDTGYLIMVVPQETADPALLEAVLVGLQQLSDRDRFSHSA